MTCCGLLCVIRAHLWQNNFMDYQTVNGDIIKKIINDVVDELGLRRNKIIHLNLSSIFDDEYLFFDSKKLKSKEAPDYHSNNLQKKYDFIFCDMPFQGRLAGGKYISISKMLNDGGVSAFLMPSFMHVFKTQQTRKNSSQGPKTNGKYKSECKTIP